MEMIRNRIRKCKRFLKLHMFGHENNDGLPENQRSRTNKYTSQTWAKKNRFIEQEKLYCCGRCESDDHKIERFSCKEYPSLKTPFSCWRKNGTGRKKKCPDKDVHDSSPLYFSHFGRRESDEDKTRTRSWEEYHQSRGETQITRRWAHQDDISPENDHSVPSESDEDKIERLSWNNQSSLRCLREDYSHMYNRRKDRTEEDQQLQDQAILPFEDDCSVDGKSDEDKIERLCKWLDQDIFPSQLDTSLPCESDEEKTKGLLLLNNSSWRRVYPPCTKTTKEGSHDIPDPDVLSSDPDCGVRSETDEDKVLKRSETTTTGITARNDDQSVEGRLLSVKTLIPSQREESLEYSIVPTSVEISQDPHEISLYKKTIQDGTEIARPVRVNIVGNSRQGKSKLIQNILLYDMAEIQNTHDIVVQQFSFCRSTAGKLSHNNLQRIKDEDILIRHLSVKPAAKEQLIHTSDIDCQNLKPKGKRQTGIASCNNCQIMKKACTVNTVEKQYLLSKLKDIDNTDSTVINARKTKLESSITKPLLPEDLKKMFKEETQSDKYERARKENDTLFDFWDFGGQSLLYATLSLFHSRRAIYLLVFDLSLGLDQFVDEEYIPVQSTKRNVEYYLKFWMNSIHSNVGTEDGTEPIVILVGTHKDKLVGESSQKKTLIAKYFCKVRMLFRDSKICKHFYKKCFAVDNNDANDPEISSLRETIIKIGEQRSRAVPVPAKWIQLEKALDEIKGQKIVSMQTVLDLDEKSEFPIRDIQQIKLFLSYNHGQGKLFYLDENPVSGYVILDPQFLIDAVKCIITGEQFCSNDPEKEPLWRVLQTEARLELSLIDHIWGNSNHQMFNENKNIMLAFLDKHRIIIEAIAFDEATQTPAGLGWYIVPSFLRTSFDTEIEGFLCGKSTTLLQFVMEFLFSTVVELVFYRLMAAVAGKWPIVKYRPSRWSETDALIYENACVVGFNNHAGIIELYSNEIRLSVVSRCPSVHVQSEEADYFRRFCESVVQHEFGMLKASNESQQTPYAVRFACNHESHQGRGSKEYLQIHACKTVPCPDELTHDINVDKAKAEWYIVTNFTDSELNRELTDRLLGSLSQCIGENWEFLGINLGISQVKIDQLKMDNISTKIRIYQMLLQWRSQADSPTLKKLLDALIETTTVRVDWDEVRTAVKM